jgi:hypothetical protein
MRVPGLIRPSQRTQQTLRAPPSSVLTLRPRRPPHQRLLVGPLSEKNTSRPQEREMPVPSRGGKSSTCPLPRYGFRESVSPARGPPTDWGELAQVHDDREIVQGRIDELPAIDIHSL